VCTTYTAPNLTQNTPLSLTQWQCMCSVLMKLRYEGVCWIYQIQNKDHLCSFVNKVMNSAVPGRIKNLLTSWSAISWRQIFYYHSKVLALLFGQKISGHDLYSFASTTIRRLNSVRHVIINSVITRFCFISIAQTDVILTAENKGSEENIKVNLTYVNSLGYIDCVFRMYSYCT
jgi:hypothetical protein